MDNEDLIAWFGVMFPLVFSPGPGNIVLAGAGMKQGVLRSFPLIFGINLIIVIYALVIGFGLGEFLKLYPNILFGIKILGIIYVLYLAYKFLKIKDVAAGKENSKVYGFYDGVLFQLLNPKGLVMLFLMFSLFLNKSMDSTIQVISLIGMLVVLNISTNTIWVAGGSVITRFMADKKSRKILNYAFSIALALVAVWLLVEAVQNY
jgi:threonine/homoserine/homoserine lactone efflux protein